MLQALLGAELRVSAGGLTPPWKPVPDPVPDPEPAVLQEMQRWVIVPSVSNPASPGIPSTADPSRSDALFFGVTQAVTSPTAQHHSSYLPGHLLIWHREAQGVGPWIQEVSGKHVVWGLALLGFPIQVNLLVVQGFGGACEADTDSRVPQSRAPSPALWAGALLRGWLGLSMGLVTSPGAVASLLLGPGLNPREGGNGLRRG